MKRPSAAEHVRAGVTSERPANRCGSQRAVGPEGDLVDGAQGPRPGVESKDLTVLVDRDRGRVMMIGLFANEEDLRASESALEAMSPPKGAAKRTSVDVYEVGAEARL